MSDECEMSHERPLSPRGRGISVNASNVSAAPELRREGRGPDSVRILLASGAEEKPQDSVTLRTKNARRLEGSKLPGVLMIQDSGDDTLDHAEHDRANNGERDIGGDNAQCADQSTIGHWQNLPGVTSL